MKVFAFITSLLISLPAFAALPPYFESTRILKAIIANDAVASKLGSGKMIQTIERIEKGYRVSNAGGCGLDVEVVYSPLPPGFVGPAKFTLKVGEPSCSAAQ